MNIFKKLFGNPNNRTYDSNNEKVNIESPASDDLNTRIIKLDNYICQLCNYGDKTEDLTDGQKDFYFNQNLEREINNGGFYQYFFNSSGDFANETIQSLKNIRAEKTADILVEAINQFPDKNVPRDRDKRQSILEAIEQKAVTKWRELDQQFYKYEDDLNALNMEYVEENKICP